MVVTDGTSTEIPDGFSTIESGSMEGEASMIEDPQVINNGDAQGPDPGTVSTPSE